MFTRIDRDDDVLDAAMRSGAFNTWQHGAEAGPRPIARKQAAAAVHR